MNRGGGRFRRAVDSEGTKILEVWNVTQYKIKDRLLYYIDGGYLRAIDRDGRKVVDQYGGQLPK